MASDMLEKAQKIIIEAQDSSRKSKSKSQIQKEMDLINSAYSSYQKTLDSKKAKGSISEQEAEELKAIKKSVPINSYKKSLTDSEKKGFYGDPERKFNIILEDSNLRPDKMYFWLLDYFGGTQIKTDDSVVFGAMSQYGNQFAQTRGGKQQVAQQYLKTISDVMRSIFPLLYEIKQSEELLHIFHNANKIRNLVQEYKQFSADNKNRVAIDAAFAAERSLRDKWATEADGGKLFTLARPQSQQGPGYVLLPHWFFSTKVRHPKEGEDWTKTIGEAIESMKSDKGLTAEIANVLGNYLLRFKIWQQESFKQLEETKKFKISFIRQQYANIKLYIEWLRPILKTIGNMAPKYGRHNPFKDKPENNPHIYSVLDTNIIDLEFVSYDGGHDFSKSKYCCFYVVTMSHKTSNLTFNIGGQNQNVPFGCNDMKMKSYVWTKEQFEMYLEKKQSEEFDILESMYDSMGDIRSQLESYLIDGIDLEYGEKLKKSNPSLVFNETKKHKSKKGMKLGELFGPFKYLVDGMKTGVMPFSDILAINFKDNKKDKEKEFVDSKSLASAKENADKLFGKYDVFKKAHKCTTW